MSVNRSFRRAAEKKAVRSGASPVQLLKGLANLDGVANLSAKLEEFLVASRKMEAIAEKLDEAGTLEALGDVRVVATTLKDQVQIISYMQAVQVQVLIDLIDFLMEGVNPDLEALISRLKEAHGGT